MAMEGEATKGIEGQPSPDNSDKGAGQHVSEREFVTVAQFKEIQEGIKALQRSLQSEKDRAVKRTNERLERLEGDLVEVLRSAQREGKNISDLLATAEQQEEQEFKSTVRQLAQQLKGAGSVGSGVGNGGTNGVDISSVLKELELPVEDLRVKEFMSRQFTSEADAIKQAAKLQKQILTSQPSDADLPSKTSDNVSYASKQEALMAEYKAGSKNLYGNALIQYKSEMRKKGLDIS